MMATQAASGYSYVPIMPFQCAGKVTILETCIGRLKRTDSFTTDAEHSPC